ncbi:MAG TPA: hypothetical protein VFY45_21100, partial [Baekduia sp.]|nr:hypothetical protein [Baekduia sp.]
FQRRLLLHIGRHIGLIEARVSLAANHGSTTVERAAFLLGSLPLSLARASVQRYALTTNTVDYHTSCHRFSPKRVDCATDYRQRSLVEPSGISSSYVKEAVGSRRSGRRAPDQPLSDRADG